MKKIITAFLILGSFSQSFAWRIEQVDGYPNLYKLTCKDGKVYEYSTEKLAYDSADRDCKSHGGFVKIEKVLNRYKEIRPSLTPYSDINLPQTNFDGARANLRAF
jgi:hypothetical protein